MVQNEEATGPQISTCRKQAIKTTWLQTHLPIIKKRQDTSEGGAESHGELFSDPEINQGTSSLCLAGSLIAMD